MKILQVIASLSPSQGGPTFVAKSISKALAARGHEVLLFSTDRGGVAIEPDRGDVRVNIFNEVFSPYCYSPALSKALEREIPSVDLVHIHGMYLHPTVKAAQVARLHKIPYVLRPAGAFDPYHLNRKAVKKAIFDVVTHNNVIRNASAFHFTTDIEQDISSAKTGKVPGFVVPNGLDIETISSFSRSDWLRRKFPSIGDRRIVLSLGRINFKKGFEVLIPAFAQAAREEGDLHLVIAGNDDGHLGTVKRLIAENDIEHITTLSGFMNDTEKYQAYADADIFVLPSYSENFANSLFEALACGTPSIISNKVNSWPEISAASAAIVIEPDIEALSKSLITMLRDPTQLRQLSENARSFSRSKYAWAAIAELLEVQYLKIVSRNQAKAD